MISESPICVICKNNFTYFEDGRGGFKCNAFLNGIPDSIINGIDMHQEQLPEQYDNEIVFELDEVKAKEFGVTVEDFVDELEA